jgi:hypothetical protein
MLRLRVRVELAKLCQPRMGLLHGQETPSPYRFEDARNR